jgi:diaminopimelate epimerase
MRAMTSHQFHKMHGLGNDFVIFDARQTGLSLSSEQVAQLAHRQHGIGCDQLVIIGPSDRADVSMQIFNQDGGEVAACGNATRCVVSLIGKDVTIETKAGILSGVMKNEAVTVDMGPPTFDWDKIPLAYAMDTLHMPIGWDGLNDPAAVNMGNPHVIFFVDDIEVIDLANIGPIIEHDPVFPERVNVNIAHIAADGIHLRVWERGAGPTLACGTGACATAVAAIRRRLVSGPVTVHLPGGSLVIDWSVDDQGKAGNVSMTGPVTHVFRGEIEI